jgi:phage shock protein E
MTVPKKRKPSKQSSARKRIPSKQSPARKRIPFWLWGVLVALVGISVVVIYLISHHPASAELPAVINIDQAYQKYQKGVFFLDVRKTDEWNSFYIPNTTLIPLDQLQTRLNDVPKDQEIVVVCRTGNRSQQGRNILKQAGFSQVTSMAGGITAWQAAGYPVAINSP